MAGQSLDFGHVKKSLGTFINMVAGLFTGEGGEAESDTKGDGDALNEQTAEEAGEEIFESENWAHFGFDSRPHPEDSIGRCEVLFSRDEAVTIATKDRRYRINLKDGEVGIYTGEKGEVKCYQVLKPDGTVMMDGKNLGIMMTKKDGSGGDVVISGENEVTLTRAGGSASMVSLNDKGGVQMVTEKGNHVTVEDGLLAGKATVQVEGASMILTGAPGGLPGKAEMSASHINLVGTVGVGASPVKFPVATMTCMAGPFPILNGTTALWAQFP